MLATVAAADSTSTVRKKYSLFIYSEAEPHAMYASCKQTHTLCVLQYFHNFPFLDTVALKKYVAKRGESLSFLFMVFFRIY